MLVELGNVAPTDASVERKSVGGEPRVTYIHIPEADSFGLGGYSQPDTHADSMFPDDLATLLTPTMDRRAWRLMIDGYLAHPSGVKGFPDHEAFVSIVDPAAAWQRHSTADAAWVRAPGHPGLEAMLSKYFGCSVGAPADLEATHWTRNGMPGVGPAPFAGITASKLGSGADIQALQMGGQLLGETGTATATSATSLTSNSAVTHVANDLAGQTVVAWSSGAQGLIVSNTSGTNTVLTIDRWGVPATPGGTAAATPSGTTGYTILTGGLPAFFAGLTTSSTPVTGALVSEITTVGGGLIRKICPWAHTAGVASYTLSPVFTANGTDSLPVTVAMMGISQSLTSAVRNIFQSVLNATATFALSGDQISASDAVSL